MITDEKEKERFSLLSPKQKFKSLQGSNKLGELHTTQGKTMKDLAQDYGLAFAAIWTGVWCFTGVLTYGAIELGGFDAVALVAKADSLSGYDFSSKIDPTYGKIGVVVVINELFEPLRLPFTQQTKKTHAAFVDLSVHFKILDALHKPTHYSHQGFSKTDNDVQ